MITGEMKPFQLCRAVMLLAMSAAGWASDKATIVPAPAGEKLSEEFKTFYSQDDQRGTVRDVVFKDIAVTSRVTPASRLQGFDAEHGIDGVVFENVRFNGQAVTNAAAGQIAIGAHVRDEKFIVPATEAAPKPPAPPRILL